MTMPEAPAELLDSTGYLLARMGTESRRRFVEALAQEDVTLAAYSVLMILGGAAGITQRRLADAVGIDPRNLVPILDDLEARGFLVRSPHADDRRRHAVKLSAPGRAKLGRLAEVGAQAEREMLSPLSRNERTHLHALLRKLLR